MTTAQIPDTMRAVLYNRPSQTLELSDSWPISKPALDKGEHLLKVHSVAITKGELDWPFPPEFYKDYSPGVEMSGTVVTSPPDSKFPAGSHVYMRTTSPRSGSAREYTIGLETELAFRPPNLTAEQAASIPVSALTAWQALFVQAGYRPPMTLNKSQQRVPIQQQKKVLIIGASGSVGVWATQLGHVAGLQIYGTCHTRNVDMVHDLGAHEVIDYTKMTIRQWIDSRPSPPRFDLVLDCVNPSGSPDAWYAADPDHGLVLSIVPPEDMQIKQTIDRPEGVSAAVEGRFFIMESDGRQLQRITELVGAEKMKPVVDSVFELHEYKRAFEKVEKGATTGKVVIRIGS